MNNKVEINPFTGKELNPNTRIVKENGKVHAVAYFEDFLLKTGVFDDREGRGVARLNGMLDYSEWKEVRKYFKDYHQKWFKWGTAKPELVIKTLFLMRNPDVDEVTVRHKMTAESVLELKEKGMNVQDGLTGEYLIPVDDE